MIRIGFGIDGHEFKENIPLYLGGVKIPYKKGLFSHSDGDVVIHSIIDALLGAAGLGDIGTHFPDTDDSIKNISSDKLLLKTLEIINEHNTSYVINNIDIVIIANEPKLEDFKEEIRKNLAGILKIEISQINIKAKTSEGITPKENTNGIYAYSICLIKINENEQ